MTDRPGGAEYHALGGAQRQSIGDEAKWSSYRLEQAVALERQSFDGQAGAMKRVRRWWRLEIKRSESFGRWGRREQVPLIVALPAKVEDGGLSGSAIFLTEV